jgi:hypothetical protein
LLRNRSRAAKTKINLTNADALKTLEVLTLEFRPTCGRRSLTLGRAWNELLANVGIQGDLWQAQPDTGSALE